MVFNMPAAIHALERLVEKQHLGPVNHRCGHGQLLLHSVGEVGHQLAALIGQLHELQQLIRPLVGGRLVQPIHAAHKAQVFGRRQPAHQRHALRHHADLPLQLQRPGPEWLAQNLNAPAGRSTF
jgi:hypothetical protein